MNTMEALARSAAARGQRHKVFDLDRAAIMIASSGNQEVVAGLQGDLEWTGGVIAINGDPVTTGGTYLASHWAIPVVVIDGCEVECWRYQDETEWNAETVWPESALAILRGAK